MSQRSDFNPTSTSNPSTMSGSTLRPPGTLSPYEDHRDEYDVGRDQEDETFDPFAMDPQLGLRRAQTAHSVIAESIRAEAAQEKRKRKKSRLISGLRRMPTLVSNAGSSMRKRATTVSESGTLDSRTRSSTLATHSSDGRDQLLKESTTSAPSEPPTEPPSRATPFPMSLWKGKGKKVMPRRTIYVNLPLPTHLLKKSGDPLIRYARNKVRTSKYTLITFIPKNLFEQFRRVANMYFLILVILQLFQIFGAPNGRIGMLPLLAIVGMTGIKDGIEDWRRAKLDDEVNNSATTKLEGWRNVNQPRDSRTWFERVFGGGTAPGKASKGVRKLRQAEAKAGKQIVMDRQKDLEELEEGDDPLSSNIPTLSITEAPDSNRHGPYPDLLNRHSFSQSSTKSKRSVGVLDWNDRAVGGSQWERTLWKKLEVGDLVLLSDNEQVPADIIVLSTSNADNLCFVETKNLDGETNLKIRKGLKATSAISSEDDLEHAKFLVDSEAPHANLYNYNGVLRYTPAEDKGRTKQEAITINEMLLRGCSLRNTKWIIGLVVFTGEDTKIMLNGGETPSKRSKIEKETNFNVAMNFVILIIICALTAVLHGWYRSNDGTSAQSYEFNSYAAQNIYLDSVIIFFSCLIVFQNIVPISLYITIEVVKTIQAYFIFQDVEMYYDVYNTPCVPKTWNISDDLGQIEYVFSDKTGTLTQNIMEFKKCSIRGVTFGEGITEAMMGAAKRDGQETGPAMEDQAEDLAELKDKMLDTMRGSINNRYLRDDKLTLIAPDMATRLANPDDKLRPHIINFFRALAICHTVLSDAPDPAQPFVLDYKAESPDEAALVAAARDVGFPFVNKTNNRIDIEVLGRVERWIPLRVLEFNSSRKRMSVVVRDPNNRLVLFCKGADSVIYERLDKNRDAELRTTTLKDLETFANGGLRTLCISYRYLGEEEFERWAADYDAACAAINDREQEIENACEKIEHSLIILGATALEDKLQEGVPDAIATLHKAGIKLWILTGDKLQTAIEIGYSCNLLTNDMEVMIISTDSEAGARSQIEAALNKVASVLGPPPIRKKGKLRPVAMTGSGPTFAVVIDGESLRYALQPSLKPLFLELGTQCAAVICCRVSPSQKALTVRLVKEGCNAMTLAIGDGANDVAMIQEANIGVGLFGLEGSQAAMSADYAFGQFRFLTRLLLVHGRWSYVRIADMHANFFYKNVIWTLALFWYLIYCSFDATYVFEYTLLLFYNTFFTSLPVGILGSFDQDTNAKASLAFPQLYKRGIRGLDYSRLRFWSYMADGLYQSLVIFFIPFFAYGAAATWSSTGRDTAALNDLGSTIAVAGVLCANTYVGINTRYWTWITAFILIVSTLLIYAWIPIYSSLATLSFSGEASVIYPTFTFWATTIIALFTAVMPRWLVKSFKTSYMPKDRDIIREAWIAGDLKNQLGIKHRKDRKRKGGKSPQPEAAEFADIPDDDRGFYEAAAIASPNRDFSRSPAQSESGRPLFSYPPAPTPNTLSPEADPRATVPAPLPLRTTSISPPHSSPNTPLKQKSGTNQYPSPVETYSMASAEIKRISRDSTALRRASLNADEELISPSNSPSKRQPDRFSPLRRLSGGNTPTRSNSIPLTTRWESPSNVSPVRSSFERTSRNSNPLIEPVIDFSSPPRPRNGGPSDSGRNWAG